MPPENSEETHWFAQNLLPHEAMLRAWLLSRYPAGVDVDDVIQEAYLKVLGARKKGPVNAPKAFLFATARNLALNAVRYAKVRGEDAVAPLDEFEVLDEGAGVHETVARNQELEILTKAIQTLPDRCRQIFTLRKVYGMSQRDITKKLNISARTVNAHISIGVNKVSIENQGGRVSREERIKKEASDWVALQDRGLSAREQDAFFEWLAEDPLHSEVYSRRRFVWREMNVLVDWKPEHSLEPNPDLLAVSKKRSKLVWFSAISGIAALLAIGLFLNGQWESAKQSGSVMLAAGEGARFYEHHVLEDGSTVELNRGAQVSVRFTEGKRLVDLLSGEAHFTVEKDPSRPFIVRARGTVVQAVGTAFNVLLNSEEVEVLVTEGRVLVNPSIATTRESVIDEREPLVRALNAGQRSVVDLGAANNPPEIEEVTSEDIEKRLAWKNELLDFTNTPLSEVVLEFNRRNHTQLVIGDASLNELPIIGSLKPQNLDGFVQMLELTDGVVAERDGVSKIILREAN